ncbi:conserved membrane hypothetical protein [Vibrio crassostreae]|uniref:Uncharacterized protein n=2 Tax=Vibrio TaxID=662 RepID=A0A4R3P7U3_9VIBR|nr:MULTISPECIES: hypothetical protein [Vibrio]MDH5919847.1 hypothetical protein [Vibrio splendidus]MDH5936629.1 hypothetical protein [Vibrio splendidus]MDH5951280.1 hypothetical protein [Vibrio crassostreae]TCN05509.1 hypothetical protein EDB35_1165 [Vibrio crassostreae]TCT46167.1 hypothetical protein EDB39_11439 [Vibrio crassostreae]
MNTSTAQPYNRWRRSRHVITLLLCLLVASALAFSLDGDTLSNSAYAWYMVVIRAAIYGIALWRAKRYAFGIALALLLNELILLTQYVDLGALSW